MDENEDEIATVATTALLTVLLARSRQKKRRKRKVWVKPWIASRETDGAFHKLMKDLEKDVDSLNNYLRMDLPAFEELLGNTGKYLQKKDTVFRNSISPAEQLAVTLRFLATGESYTSLQYQFRINKGTLSIIIPKVCDTIANNCSDYIKCPSAEEKWREIADEFYQRWQLPNCIGAIDGKHVRIVHPQCSGSDYYNYKGFYSIVLMAIVSPSSEFIYADVGCQGRISDGGVFRNTNFFKALEANSLGIPNPQSLPTALENRGHEDEDSFCQIPHYFVGDDAFSLAPNMMKPYPQRGLTEEQRIFNYRLSRARRVSENAFGILSAKFRVFHTTLCTKPENAVVIVHVALLLHNFLLRKCPSVYAPVGSLDHPNEQGEIINGDWRQSTDIAGAFSSFPSTGCNHPKSASKIRDCLSQYVNGPGQVQWQWKTLLP